MVNVWIRDTNANLKFMTIDPKRSIQLQFRFKPAWILKWQALFGRQNIGHLWPGITFLIFINKISFMLW